jgi:AcrR family transcriptional regulator
MGRPPRRLDEPATRERLLRAATQAFARHGSVRANLAEIAQEAGISRPSLLYYFHSKDALYAEVVVTAFQGLGEALLLAAREGVDPVRLAVAFEGYLEAHPEVARLVLQELLETDGPGRAVVVGQVAPLLEQVEGWLLAAGYRAAADLSLRAALFHVVSDALVRVSARSVRQVVWGPAAPVSGAVAALLVQREGE